VSPAEVNELRVLIARLGEVIGAWLQEIRALEKTTLVPCIPDLPGAQGSRRQGLVPLASAAIPAATALGHNGGGDRVGQATPAACPTPNNQ